MGLRRSFPVAVLASVLAASASTALAHVERPAYFPDPAGPGVPEARTLSSALDTSRRGTTRVVCRPDSMQRLRRSIDRARANGYFDRPSGARRTLSAADAQSLWRINSRLRARCSYSEIQPAVTRSRNYDRVVIMPGLYTEPTARKQPTNDPKCQSLRTNGDKPGEEGTALSYAYQVKCPNDQNLIAVMGRTVSPKPDPIPPRQDRHGIPNPGDCIRCNVQIEGSGVNADDVVIDAGDASKGNGGPNGVGSAKDVAIRADRADGFVLRNVTTRHAGEHGIYVLETDGYLLDRFKAFYNKLYGTLTFASDHGVQQNCEAAGHGDSGVYPGGAPETGVQRKPGTSARFNQDIRRCDLHHNMSGYSGTNGNAAHVYENAIYDNALGITTDVVTGAGHPGYPGDSIVFERNRIFSNNFNPYAPESDVKPSFPFPVGTGLWIAGGNHHKVRENLFYDNWRRGTMVFSVPDSLVCGPLAEGNEQAGCEDPMISTSHYNQTHDNRMGVRPDGTPDPNGTDFWWDVFPGSRGNCWFRNTGPAPITTDPPLLLSDCDDGKDPARSIGTGSHNELELLRCVAAFETRSYDPNGPCPWVRTPPEPQPAAAGGSGPAPLPGVETRQEPLPGVQLPVPLPVRAAGRRSAPVPLGQATCGDWNRAGESGRPALARRIRAFAGGVVNDGSRNLGTGAVLPGVDAIRLFNGWCGQAYAREFLLYKLYTYAAAFSGRGRVAEVVRGG